MRDEQQRKAAPEGLPDEPTPGGTSEAMEHLDAASREKPAEKPRLLTPLEVLENLVAEIKAEKLSIDMIVIGARQQTDDFKAHYFGRSAGVDHLEAVGLLHRLTHMIEADIQGG